MEFYIALYIFFINAITNKAIEIEEI